MCDIRDMINSLRNFLLNIFVVRGRNSSDKYFLWLRTRVAFEERAMNEDDENDRFTVCPVCSPLLISVLN